MSKQWYKYEAKSEGYKHQEIIKTPGMIERFPLDTGQWGGNLWADGSNLCTFVTQKIIIYC